MRIKYFLGQVKDRMTVGGQRILGVLMLLLTVVSCAIENDIPYPIVEASIESMVVEGQRGADSNVFAEATINKSARTVTIYVNDSVDVTKLKVTCLKITPGAELIPDSTACVDFQKFPAEGFTSLDSIPASSNTRMDFSSPVHFTLRTYQDYVWTVSVQQLIQRDVEVEGMVDCVIDDNSRVVIVYVGQDQDLTNLNVTKMNLGGEFGTVSPDPTIIKDYSSPVKFYVRRSWEEYSYEWTVYVYKDSEEAGGGTTEAFAMTTRATVNGKIQSGKTPVVEYCKQNATSWTTVPAANVSVSGNSFTATLTGLNASTAYKYRISVDGTVGSEQTFTTAAATPLENGSMEEWSQDDKQWNPWTAGKDAFWGTGNKGSKFINKNITSPVDDSVSGKAAYLESMNALNLKLAAGNLFTGDFELDGMNGLLHFGRPFTSFPTSLRLYYKYTPATIDMIGDNVGDLATLKGQTDMFQIYIALSDKSEPYEIRNNPKNRQLFDPNDANIIAYGEYTSSESVTSYKELEIPLEYRATNRTPKYIIIVASSSKYGDYYIGGVGSKLWLDEMELVYE
ncbi:PCMD domain-containing protein [Phocaeicola barnesiae]|uniref:PCMD domain-containing protein n=1 Tax=Phocaeicola barnesiae TaxID=376804 RepID=UPI0025A3BDD9|nr:PCMD domain-containing protein [Phocaeicola barnesiae]MDM8232661.1 PCMD domain-containing protein [Phocaeicola barnesiae]